MLLAGLVDGVGQAGAVVLMVDGGHDVRCGQGDPGGLGLARIEGQWMGVAGGGGQVLDKRHIAGTCSLVNVSFGGLGVLDAMLATQSSSHGAVVAA